MKRFCALSLLLFLSACGVPRESLQLVYSQVGLPAENLSDDDVAAALRSQSEQWQRLSDLLRQQQLGGILFVDQHFVDLVHQTTADAKRLRELIDTHQDDPALRRELLAAFKKLWGQAELYLSDTKASKAN
jgi:hypothetical protein